jgi:hypothetical protein
MFHYNSRGKLILNYSLSLLSCLTSLLPSHYDCRILLLYLFTLNDTHTHTHNHSSLLDYFGRVIGLSQKPIPDNIQGVQHKSGPYVNTSNLFTKVYNILYYATNLYLQWVLEMMSIHFNALIDTFHRVPRNFS